MSPVLRIEVQLMFVNIRNTGAEDSEISFKVIRIHENVLKRMNCPPNQGMMLLLRSVVEAAGTEDDPKSGLATPNPAVSSIFFLELHLQTRFPSPHRFGLLRTRKISTGKF